MKAYLKQLLRDIADPIIGYNLVREYLDARILESLQRARAMVPLLARQSFFRFAHLFDLCAQVRHAQRGSWTRPGVDILENRPGSVHACPDPARKYVQA